MYVNKYESKCDTRTVDTIIIQTERALEGSEKYIDLNPIYQRDIVWSDEKQGEFINSVISGIVPNNLILNYDHDDGKEICIDGKQRITSLLRFKNNEICCKITDENDKTYNYYFNKIPSSLKNNDKYKILTQKHRNSFLNRQITFVTYQNLPYMDQVDIFNRIQNGLALTEGEKISSLIIDENINAIINNFFTEKKHLFSKFNNKRENHKIIITNIMMIYNVNKLQTITKSQRNKYLKDLNVTTLNKILSSISPLIDFAFNFLNNDMIPNKISTNLLYSAIFWLMKHKYDLQYKTLSKNIQNQRKYRCVIRLLSKEKTKENIDDTRKKVLDAYKKITMEEVEIEENKINLKSIISNNLDDEISDN
ncbi:protein of unknown function DUF262 [Hokovirus HKV1]|uniref:GmrSD restriction endonucleases N-terminal domain-containing protein n=1 Tax=Hokovirus HKV1 TaxID=1977638 RepID=A0A1V0SF45_9VIRU|nr:protein of unknown function DUF262 [Hokovirus HKV1]